MFKEYEVDYASRICERFGLVYYGCCDPLDDRMAEVRMLPNVRKISISPWSDQERAADDIGDDFVFSRKPSPALLATNTFKPEVIRDEMRAVRELTSAPFGVDLLTALPQTLERAAQVIIDEGADAAQRVALEKILLGESTAPGATGDAPSWARAGALEAPTTTVIVIVSARSVE